MIGTTQAPAQKAKVRSSVARLRVLAVNSLFPNHVQPYWGIFNAHALKYLAALADVRVISPVKWFPGLAWTSDAERRLTQVPAAAEYHGIPVSYPRFFRTPGFGRRWHSWMYAASIRRHLINAVQEHKPDVLLASWTHPDGCAVQQLGARLGIPVVIKCLGSDVHQLLSEPARGAQVLDAFSRCARIVTVSEGLRTIIVGRGIPAEKVERVYNGVDRIIFHHVPRAEARAKLNLPPHGKILLCVANLLPIKGHSDLLHAFKIVRRNHKIDAQLVLVGEGPLRKSLTEEARTLGILEYVKFAGSCKHDQVPQWINASDAVCLASHNEGLPNVLVEALACGRPVVATKVGGIPELVSSPQYGRLVDAGDSLSMAQSIREVLGCVWEPEILAACPEVISWQESATALRDVLLRACT